MISDNESTKPMSGFDFIRQFAQAATGQGEAPNFASWIAPTVSIEELDKRITDLKAVRFWLEQSLQAIRATEQALEVQKMTLAALQGMNLSLADIAQAFTVPGQPADKPAPGVPDPLQWWGALTQQFQTIAADTLREAAQAAPAVSPTAANLDPAVKPARKATKIKSAVKKKRPASRRSNG